MGLLGKEHCKAIAKHGGNPVILENNSDDSQNFIDHLNSEYGCEATYINCDIAKEKCVYEALKEINNKFQSIDILINNAAVDHKVIGSVSNDVNSFESFALDAWNEELKVGLTGAMICTKLFGSFMAGANGGVILNISSDLGLIAPDQRIYRNDKIEQNFYNPVTYSVIKHGIIGLTKYTATYWPEKVRCNALCPGGVYNNQPDDFVKKLANLIPMGRMANLDEYQSTIVYLVSDASSYMTGAILAVDGGRSCW
jgi:NAD(P)-dependent dehydrogenase (short-subunit alcohol dehydrogenase family)